jgi:hypothetical protein
MTRNKWESTFRRQLKAQLDITPEQLNFRWQMYFSQRYSPEQAIAHLIEIHRLMPTRGVLPATASTTSSFTTTSERLEYR